MEELGYMEKVQDLERKVNKLEYEEIKNIKDEITTIKINLAENNILTRQSVESTDKLSDTLTTVKETMIQMSESMKTNNKVSEELASSVKNLNHQVNGLEEKMDCKFREVDVKINEQEEKGKFDIIKWTRDNWVAIISVVGVITYIILGKVGII